MGNPSVSKAGSCWHELIIIFGRGRDITAKKKAEFGIIKHRYSGYPVPGYFCTQNHSYNAERRSLHEQSVRS